MLIGCVFIISFVDSIGEQQSGTSERAQWSEGVEDLINDAARSGLTLFPKAALGHISIVFKSKHERVVKSITSLLGPSAACSLLKAASANLNHSTMDDPLMNAFSSVRLRSVQSNDELLSR